MTENAEMGSWIGPAVMAGGFLLSLVTTLLGIGAMVQKNRRTAEDVAELKTEHGKKIDAAHAVATAASSALADYKLAAIDKFVPRGELTSMEHRLVERIDGMRREFVDKVDEIKVEVNKKGIEHTIKNAFASAMSEARVADRRRTPS